MNDAKAWLAFVIAGGLLMLLFYLALYAILNGVT